MALDACYARFGVVATWLPADGPSLSLTLVPLDPESAASGGGGWDSRPQETPAHSVAVRGVELAALGLMSMDGVSREPTPSWAGASLTYAGANRKILKKPLPLDPLRLEWRLDLS